MNRPSLLSRNVSTLALFVACAFGLATPAAMRGAPAGTAAYIVIADDTSLPAGLQEEIAAIGGTIRFLLPDIGIAVADSGSPSFASDAATIPGVRSIVRDARLRLAPVIDPGPAGLSAAAVEDDFLFPMQWALDAIDAPEAWAAGARGAGVRVAVLDTGIDVDHPDLAPNLNLSLSTSFIPGVALDTPPGPPSFTAPAHHGTWVAGIIAAADNGIGTIGVAPQAEIVAVRVCTDDGVCDMSAILAGLVHAATIGADVINMSLGGTFPRRGFVGSAGTVFTARDVAELAVASTRALQFAGRLGSMVVVAAGNDGRNLDLDADMFQWAAQLPHTVSVAATSPQGWAVNPATSLDVPAPYTNYGRSVIDLAAPGGYLDLNALMSPPSTWTFCTIVVTGPCFAFDMVAGPTSGGWSVGVGTSAATPHVSGVAALVIGRHGSRMPPSEVKTILQSSADDLGQPGVDEFYGHGRVNAARSVRMR